MQPGTVAWWVFTVWSGLASLAWLVSLSRGLYGLWRLPALHDLSPPDPPVWPRLSVVIPACNEADTLEAALETVLAQDYPGLELVLVEDRSTDGTGAIVDRMAARDARIRVVHVTELPEGWLGKVHALEQGVRASKSDWILFTDADVHYAPGTLRKAIAISEARGLDHLTLVPKLASKSFFHEAVIDAFGGMVFQAVRPDEVSDPDSEAAMGAGAFNLVRRSALERTAGFEWLRMEVVDDFGLALLLKRARARADVLLATREVEVLWYPTLPDMVRGLEKNLYGILGHYRLGLFVARIVAFTALIVGPFLAPLSGLALTIAAALALSPVLLFARVLQRRADHAFWPVMILPLAQLFLIYIACRSAWVCVRQRGIVWRGTRYPLDVLRELQRVKL